MGLQARKINGNVYTAEDTIEIICDDTAKSLAMMNLTIEVISGVDVTHGGGASEGTYLHYKNPDVDADDDGDLDYSSTIMKVEQVEKGTSVIRIKGSYLTKTQVENHNTALDTWEDELVELETQEEINAHNDNVPVLTENEYVTGNITLDWNDLDAYV